MQRSRSLLTIISLAMFVIVCVSLTGCPATITEVYSIDPALACTEINSAVVWVQAHGSDTFAVYGTVIPDMDPIVQLTDPGSDVQGPRLIRSGNEFFLAWYDVEPAPPPGRGISSGLLRGVFLTGDPLAPSGSVRLSDPDHVPEGRTYSIGRSYDIGYHPGSNMILAVWTARRSDGAYGLVRQIYDRSARRPVDVNVWFAYGEEDHWYPRIAVGSGDHPFLVTHIESLRGDQRVMASLVAPDGTIGPSVCATARAGNPQGWGPYRRAAAAYDPVNHRYLIVYDTESTGSIRGRLINETGELADTETYIGDRTLVEPSEASRHMPLMLTFNQEQNRYMLGYHESIRIEDAIGREPVYKSIIYTQILDTDGRPVSSPVRRESPDSSYTQGYADLDSNNMFRIVYERGEYVKAVIDHVTGRESAVYDEGSTSVMYNSYGE
jgi:hypothetical protein